MSQFYGRDYQIKRFDEWLGILAVRRYYYFDEGIAIILIHLIIKQ